MKRGIDPESFGFLVNDVARLVRAEMDRRIAASGLGLTPGDARVLAYAARFEPVRQSVLAERAALEPMTVSTYLDTLEARGLIERQTDPADRRAKLVTLTAAGTRQQGAEAVHPVGPAQAQTAQGGQSEVGVEGGHPRRKS